MVEWLNNVSRISDLIRAIAERSRSTSSTSPPDVLHFPPAIHHPSPPIHQVIATVPSNPKHHRLSSGTNSATLPPRIQAAIRLSYSETKPSGGISPLCFPSNRHSYCPCYCSRIMLKFLTLLLTHQSYFLLPGLRPTFSNCPLEYIRVLASAQFGRGKLRISATGYLQSISGEDVTPHCWQCAAELVGFSGTNVRFYF